MKKEESTLPKSLTKSQLSLWTGQKMHIASPLYNMVHTFTIHGPIKVSVFQEAFKELVNRCDALRTVFMEKDAVPYQIARNKLEYLVDFYDLSRATRQYLDDWILKRSIKAFDLSDCCFDSVLIKSDDNQYIWFLNVHHLVTDATSSMLLANYLSQIYARVSNNILQDFEHIPEYEDYLRYEKENREVNDNVKTYWKEKIAQFSKPIALYGSNTSKTTLSIRKSVKLGIARTNQIKAMAQKPALKSWTEDLTLFNIFSTVLFVLLYKISGQKKQIFGSPSHNRINSQFKKTPGLFVELFPLVLDFNDEDTFMFVYERVKLETNSYLKYAQSGVINRELSNSFNVVLNYINTSFADFNQWKMDSKWLHLGHCDLNHFLRCHVHNMNTTDEIEVLFDLNVDIFKNDTINILPEHFLKILDEMLSNINLPLKDLSMVDSKKYLSNFVKSNTQLDKFSAVHLLFEQEVKNNTEAIALRYKKKTIAYSFLNEKSNQLANYLISDGVCQGAKVIIHLERTPDYIISVLAVLKAGATFIPVSSDLPTNRISHIIKDSEALLAITKTNLESNFVPGTIKIVNLDLIADNINNSKTENPNIPVDAKDIAYSIYTSGSTGTPKGILVSHNALYNYISWAARHYKTSSKYKFGLFTSIGFDLTITSTFVPLVCGGEIVIYKESSFGPDISLLEILDDNLINAIKLTPSHLALIRGKNLRSSSIETIIVGGEDFKVDLAASIQDSFGDNLKIYNEYGPTEATVGCIVSLFKKRLCTNVSVPIGHPITNTIPYVLDEDMNLVPNGVSGELYLSGSCLAEGYSNLELLSAQKFIENPFIKGTKMYRTGDIVRVNEEGEFEYKGRIDEQIKLKGNRIELPDIEVNLQKHSEVESTAVVLIEGKKVIPEDEVVNCSDCGLPSNYPNTDFDERGVCHICNAFKDYEKSAQRYFKTEDDLRKILLNPNLNRDKEYDCLSLLSGGKDSTYVLAQLKRMGLKVLAFTLDNGYISDQAKENIDNIVAKMGVDHIYGTSEYMNKIFVDSLHRHNNVCNGCFKTIYTLSTKIALHKKIPFIVTGLSRGQFFETRLTEELFWDKSANIEYIDATILEARKLYHQEEDAVKELLDTSCFKDDTTFEKVQFIDFYRYTDVSLEEMINVLENDIGWKRPTDTGRSTNCLINQVGIYVHKRNKGYSNYSYPYSWDVRMGHKTRQETLEEINEYIHEEEVFKIMKEIGYEQSLETELNQERLVAYYTGNSSIPSERLVEHLKKDLPQYMIPSHFKHVTQLPLTANGKLDKSILKNLNLTQLDMDTPFVAPKGEIEILVSKIWKEVLVLDQLGVADNFIALGGHSLAAIRLTTRINEELDMELPINKVFEYPTVAQYAQYLEEVMITILDGK